MGLPLIVSVTTLQAYSACARAVRDDVRSRKRCDGISNIRKSKRDYSWNISQQKGTLERKTVTSVQRKGCPYIWDGCPFTIVRSDFATPEGDRPKRSSKPGVLDS